jgi:hypothetical protein
MEINQSLNLKDSEAKGQNGWFRADRVAIRYLPSDRIHVEIRSERSGWNAPCQLELCPEDCRAIAELLLSFVGEEKETPCTSS